MKSLFGWRGGDGAEGPREGPGGALPGAGRRAEAGGPLAHPSGETVIIQPSHGTLGVPQSVPKKVSVELSSQGNYICIKLNLQLN